MAKAAGKSIGQAVSVKETAVEVPTLYSDSSMLLRQDAQAAAAPVAVEAGQLDITADITVVFELK